MPAFAAKPLILNGRIALDPAPDGDVIHRQPPLRHHLFEITVAQRVTQVPPDAKDDDHVLKVPSAEQRGPILAHRFTLPEPPVFLATDPSSNGQLQVDALDLTPTCQAAVSVKGQF